MPNTCNPVTPRPPILAAPWIRRDRAAAVFSGDPWPGLFGRYPTLAAAHLWCFFVSWPVTFVELAGIPLLVCTLARMHRNYRYIPSIILQPLVIAVALFGIVQFASGLWTLDRAQWLQQAGSIRWLWSLCALWPVIQHRRALILTLMAGILVGNCGQLSQALHVYAHLPTPTWPRAEDRISGWWPPVVCGTVLTAALGLHLPSTILAATARARILSTAAALATLAGIFASGTRGAWLASAMLTLLVVPAAIAVRLRSTQTSTSLRRRGPLIATLVILLMLAGAGAAALGPSIARRASLAWNDISTAVEHHDYRTDTGARIGMALWAIDLFRQHPVQGVGAGSFRPAARELLRTQGVDPDTQSVHDHAHNALLHVAATTGLLGLIPALLVIILSLRNSCALGRERWQTSSVEWGPLAALLGLLLVSLFDPVHINAQTSALLAVILSLSPSFIPVSSDLACDPPRTT